VNKVTDLQVEHLPIETLHLHPHNARQGDVGAISQSLEAHGQYRPIVVQKSTMQVLAGNHTLQAASALGWKEIAATIIDVDDDQALRILLVDNRTNDLATYDDGVLIDLLESLVRSDAGLSGSGFDGSDLDELIAAGEFTPEVEDEQGERVERSSLLDIADIAYGDPKHVVENGDVYRLSKRHYLVVTHPHVGWKNFVPFLEGNAVLCIYPDLYITGCDAAKTTPLVLVQPSHYLAGHLLDKHESLFGKDSVEKLT